MVQQQFTAIVRRAANGRWREILSASGVDGGALDHGPSRHGPCPGCGGKDRFPFDDKDGRGNFICSKGGNGNLSGDGFTLLQHISDCDFPTARNMVAAYLRLGPEDVGGQPTVSRKPPRPKAQKPPPNTCAQDYALAIWSRAERSDTSVASHPYAIAKAIGWHAGVGRAVASCSIVGQDADCIVVPIRDLATGKVVAVRAINHKGLKQTFGHVKGNAFICGNDLDQTRRSFIVEGWADAISIFRAHRGTYVFAAMGKEFAALEQRVTVRYGPQTLIALRDAE